MNSGKPKTPVTSPKIPKAVRMNAPSTPPSASKSKSKRLSNILMTPDQPVHSLPFSPSSKRTSSGSYKSPEYRLNSPGVSLPYNTNLLKTPRHTGYDSDDGTDSPRLKVQKTPQYFSPGKKLFTEESSNKEEFSEISLQLKSRLSSALGKIQQKDKPGKIKFTELTFNSDLSPTKKSKPNTNGNWSPTNSIQKANLNLQTLQQTPLPTSGSGSPTLLQSGSFSNNNLHSSLKKSPNFTNNDRSSENHITIPSPDEESSAHNALIAALSRQKKSRTLSNSGKTRPTLTPKLVAPIRSQNPDPKNGLRLPPLNVALNSSENQNSERRNSSNNEQDAVLSLMSLSSPQSVKFSHSRNHSQGNNSPRSSRSSSVLVTSPTGTNSQIYIPPISGVMDKNNSTVSSTNDNNDTAVDSDATDIDKDLTDDDDNNDDE